MTNTKTHNKNWGDYVCNPPAVDNNGRKYWDSLASAKSDCDNHAKSHKPAVSTIKAAGISKNHYIELEKENLCASL